MLNSSLLFWELSTFVVLLASMLLVFRLWTGGNARGRSRASEANSSAREVLDRRYASGESTREEYLAIKNDMTR